MSRPFSVLKDPNFHSFPLSVRSSTEQPPTQLKIKRIDRLPKKPMLVIYLTEMLKRGSQCELEIQFGGRIFDHSAEGLFKGNYFDNTVKG